jgi:uncharacterized protein (TIGR03437 family)
MNGKPAFLSYVSPTQINAQAPDGSATGLVDVVVTSGVPTAKYSVTLANDAPSLALFDSRHVAAVVLTPDGTGAYGGIYDLVGPVGASPSAHARSIQLKSSNCMALALAR